MNRRLHVARNFNCIVNTEGLLKVTHTHVHCENGNISQTFLDRDVVITGHQQEVIYGHIYSSNCGVLEDHSLIVGLMGCFVSYIYALDEKISTYKNI